MNTIGLDLGTGAIKGVCWNDAKGIIATAGERIPFDYPAPSWVELNPERYRTQVWNIIRQLAVAADGPIAGMAFAAASGNTMLCDNNGQALTPIISWLDKRLDWRPPEDWNVRPTTGWPGIPTFPLMHLEYLKRQDAALLARSHVAMNNDWLCWSFCGRHALDFSNATPFYLVNQRERRYEQRYLDYYGLTTSQLPELLNPGDVIGTLKPEWTDGNLTSQTAVVAGSFDHPAGARAAGITEPGDMLLSCGTSWVGFYPVANYKDVPLTDLCDCFETANGGCWGAMFSVSSIGLEIEDYVCSHYGKTPERYAAFNEEALKSGSAARAEMQRVVRNFQAKLTKHAAMRRVILSGGPSEGVAWPGVIEEVLGIPVELSPYKSHTGAVGAAMLAARHLHS